VRAHTRNEYSKPSAVDVTLAKRVKTSFMLFIDDFKKTPVVLNLKTANNKDWLQQAIKLGGDRWKVMSAADKLVSSVLGCGLLICFFVAL
jgi:hypothetical protein